VAYSDKFDAPRIDLASDVPVRIWNPNVLDDLPLPLLVVHDGTEYDERSWLICQLNDLISSGTVTPHRVALVDPVWGLRNNWYGASPAYQDTLANSVIPEVRKRVAVVGSIIGGGASLGAISMFGCENAFPGTFGGIFGQSTSFHHHDYGTDNLRSEYDEYDRVTALVEHIRSTAPVRKLNIGLTWTDGPGLHGNEAMGNILSDQGHIMSGGKVSGGHDYFSWGNAIVPHLGNLLSRAWSDSQH